jgi:hypothetical protein
MSKDQIINLLCVVIVFQSLVVALAVTLALAAVKLMRRLEAGDQLPRWVMMWLERGAKL